MKILHVAPVYPSISSSAGTSQVPRSLASALAEIGLDVGLLSSRSLGPAEQMQPSPGVHMLSSPTRNHYNPLRISPSWISRIKGEFGVPDIVHFHSLYSPFQCALARRMREAGWPYIFTPHGELRRPAQRTRWIKKKIANLLCFRSFVDSAEVIHALCLNEAKEIADFTKPKNIVIIPNGVDDSLLRAAKDLSAADLGSFGQGASLMLGFVGRIAVHNKGIDLLLKALKILNSESADRRFRLFLVGSFHRSRDERLFSRLMKSLALEDVVRVLGPQYGEEKLRYFLACSVFVLPSRHEGMPLTVLEAMALGKPCLVTPGTNMGQIVCEGGGWECELELGSIIRAIGHIYESRETLAARGQQSHDLMQSQFAWRGIAGRFRDEYTKILNCQG